MKILNIDSVSFALLMAVLLTSLQNCNAVSAEQKYSVNWCPQPKWPEYPDFLMSYCQGETPYGFSWHLVCHNTTSSFKSEVAFEGFCRRGYICRDNPGDYAPKIPRMAWCINSTDTSSGAGSSGISKDESNNGSEDGSSSGAGSSGSSEDGSNNSSEDGSSSGSQS